MTQSSPHPDAVAYRVRRLDPNAVTSRIIGVVTLGPDGMLSVVSVEPDRAEFLLSLVSRMNQQDTMDVAAGAPEDAPEGAHYTIPVRRGDPAFAKALFDRMRLYNDLVLEEE